MKDAQSTIKMLRELNIKLVSDIAELRKKNAEILELRNKFAKVEAKNIKTDHKENAKNAKLRDGELNARIVELEQLENGDNSENVVNIPNSVIDQCINSNSKSLVDDTREIDQSLINTTLIKIENSNNTLASENTSNSDDVSNFDICQESENQYITSPIFIEPKSLENMEIDDFLDSTHKEKVSKEIIQSIGEKKLRDQEKIITSQDTKCSLSVKGGQGLIQELFTPEPSLQESNIIQNYMIEISKTGGPEKSNIDEASQHLAQLCDKAFDAEDGANRANQEEILSWSIYEKDFKIQFNEIIKNSRGKIGKKKARSLLYDSITKQLSIIYKKRSQELGLHLPEISRDALRKKTQRTKKIYILFEKIGHDKIKYIKLYSANSISKLTNDQIQEIINYSCRTSIQIIPGKITSEIETGNITTPSIPLSHTFSSVTASSNSEDKIIEKVESLPETETKVSISTESQVSNSSSFELSQENNQDSELSAELARPKTEVSVSSENTKANVSKQSTFQPPIFTLPNDLKEKQAHIIKIVLDCFSHLLLKYNNKYGDYFTCSVSCSICNKDHKKENIRDNIEGNWGSGDYVNTKTYHLKCWEAYQNSIQIVTIKA
ncbi:16529_t:CDS:2 [Cetraspora pellucida]|uniref:16529_t:CDS:1 n=1 Tax=Cetraspora pellucida TaxID=1433469 RepID=A0A9N9JT60_9GLOM|nr:16529_t:CDS:2 [Cetraspora pellucida]